MLAAQFYLPVQELSGQKLTYAQIMKKKQEKEAAERAAQEAEESHAEGGVKGKAEDKVTPAPVQEVELKKEEAGGAGKGRLSKTNSGPSSGDKDKKTQEIQGAGEEEGGGEGGGGGYDSHGVLETHF